MPSRLHHISVPTSLLLLILLVGACSEQDDAHACVTTPVPQGAAIAVGAHASAPQPALPDQAMDAVLTASTPGPHDTSAARGLTLIRIDGRPTIACTLTVDTTARNSGAKKQARETFKSAVRDRISRMQALSPQADPLNALSLASHAAGPHGLVVLLDPGLQTTPPLDLSRTGLLDADAAGTASQLAQKDVLPDLDGQSLFLVGIGYTSPPQVNLGENNRAHLIDTWRAIGTRAGAASVTVFDTPNTTAAVKNLPPVKAVPVPPLGNVTPRCNSETVFPDSGPVGFLPNQTTFVDEKRARTALSEYGPWLAGHHPEAEVAVVGTVAHYGPDDPRGLSQDRSQRVRDLLIETGAAPGQVTATGDGWGPFPTKSAPPDARSDRLNRRVTISITCP